MGSAIALNLGTVLGQRRETAATLHSLFMGAIAPPYLTAISEYRTYQNA